MKYIIILLSLLISLQGVSQIELTYRKVSSRVDSILYDGHYIGHITYNTPYFEGYDGMSAIYFHSSMIYVSSEVPADGKIISEFIQQIIKDRKIKKAGLETHIIGVYSPVKILLKKEDISYLSGSFIKNSAKNKLSSKAVLVSGMLVGGILTFVSLPVSATIIGVSSFISFCLDVESDKKLRTAGILLEKLN